MPKRVNGRVGRAALADILTFARPSEEQRLTVLGTALKQLGLGNADIKAIVAATGPQKDRDYGFTFSDLMQRLLPAIVFAGYPDSAVSAAKAIETARAMIPTPPFQERPI